MFPQEVTTDEPLFYGLMIEELRDSSPGAERLRARQL